MVCTSTTRTRTPGATVVVQGSGCTAGALVTVFFDTQEVATGKVNPAGHYSIPFKIPGNAAAGHHTVSIKVAGGSCPGLERPRHRCRGEQRRRR